MELRTLRYFLAVAREENMTAAADELHVTQPTLSRQIAELEGELGCALFVRTNRATRLTEDGMRLRQRAEEILSLVEQTEGELAADAGELSGTIRIGAGETRAMRVMTDTFARLHHEHPHVTCELFTGNADVVEERLERGLVDFALMLDPVSLDKYEHLSAPTRDRMGVTVGAQSPWASLGSVDPAALARMPLLLSSRVAHRRIDLAAWSGGRVSEGNLNVVGSFDLIGNAALLVEAGEACALGIDRLLRPSGHVRFVPLEPKLTLGSSIVWKRGRLFSPACEKFLEYLRAVCPAG